MADGGWDDLFAKASGQHDDIVSKEVVSSKPKKKSRQKKRRRRRGTSPENDAFLAGRIRVPGSQTTWPYWSKLQTSMISNNKCSGWKDDNGKCSTCGKSPLYHRLGLEDSAVQKQSHDIIIWPLDMFCIVRNLRCTGVLVAMKDSQVHEIVHFVRNECSRLGRCMSKALPALNQEGHVFGKKCQAVMDAANTVIKDMNQSETLSEKAVRLIIACDDAYYRLYYLVISGILSKCNHDVPLRMVHPADYFHVSFLAWIGPEEALSDWNEFRKFIRRQHSECDQKEPRNVISSRYGFDPFEIDEQPEYTDALSYLHRNRAMETALLFFKSEWALTKDAAEETKEALNKPVDNRGLFRHETPAPSILAEWRDSCRDRLCNLYAYATVSGKAVQCIKDNLKDAGVSGGVIEVGAGTGYLAVLLQKAGINVVAWDIHPSNDMGKYSGEVNEYHGLTPTFCEIKKGDARAVCQQLPSLKENVALLLCYPPPESSMAKDALMAFLNNGGSCLIHIGEFGGLTGSRAFEDLLFRSFYCVDRFPCLAWGTDAAEVTVWIRTDNKHDGRGHHLLLPCSMCGKVEASKRCRLIRHVAYCSSECFRAHLPMLSTHLAINVIPLNVDALNFDNESHFAPILTGKTESDERLTGTPAKKAKSK